MIGLAFKPLSRALLPMKFVPCSNQPLGAAASRSRAKIFPSPILPVCAALEIASTTWSVIFAVTAISNFILVTKLTVYYAPPISFSMIRFGAEPFDFNYYNASDANPRYRFLNFLELKGFDCCNNQFHKCSFR